MGRYQSYLNTAKTIIQQYSGEEPFATFARKFYSVNKKYGSTDRRIITHLCYCFFRAGKAASKLLFEDRLLAALFLCSNEPNEILGEFRPGWNQQTALSFKQKLSLVDGSFGEEVFPWKDELSDGINHKEFIESFFVQPDLFLRVRPGHEKAVLKKLQASSIPFEIISPTCLAMPNASKIDSVLELNAEAVVQDYNSQKTGDFFFPVTRTSPGKVWDCCAASGGKSIMLYDLYPAADLTVSDIRESIIANLKKRFKEAGIKNYEVIVADLRVSDFKFKDSDFDFIIADVPCSGSGTWSRTPEQLYYFKKEKIDEYASLQKRIVSNVVSRLKPGGYLLYITCSAFRKENEEMIAYINKDYHLQTIRMELLNGYDKKADTMFAALLQRPLLS